MGVVTTRLAMALERVTGAEAVYSLVFDHLPHHHVHLIPRYPRTPQEYWGVEVAAWPDAPRGRSVEVEAVSERLRQAIGPVA